MKHLLLHLFACLLFVLPSKAQLNEDFSDGNITENPGWILSANSLWMINSAGQLQSNHSITNSKFWLSAHQNLADSAEWELDVQLNFNPSSANFVDIYLVASHSDPTDTALSGYFVRLGNTDDEISLYRKDRGNKVSKIIDGINGLLNKSENSARIRITRRKQKGWQLYYDDSMKGGNYISLGTASDSTYQMSNFFIVMVQQSTASFFSKHILDNIRINYFIPDKTPPYIKYVRLNSSNSLSIHFNEEMNRPRVLNNENYQMDSLNIRSQYISPDSGNANTWIVQFEQFFETGKSYLLSVRNMEDAEGNSMRDTIIRFVYYIPKKNDVIFNEIMFDPIGSSSDYIELYNRSKFPINLKKFNLSNRSASGALMNTKQLFLVDYLLMPGDYIVFTEDSFNIRSSFNQVSSAHLIELSSMPSLPNTEGAVVLTDSNHNVIDELNYREDWHFALLNNREGVALERITPDRPTQQADNWMSASKTWGYGTPTRENSQKYSRQLRKEAITLSSRIFSPDGDGSDDLLFIHYNFSNGGNILNSMVFDISGRQVRTLQKQLLCGMSGSFRWDGLNNQNSPLPLGHYIIFTEIFNLKGEVQQFKNEVVLARRPYP